MIFNIDYNSTYSTKIAFETKVVDKALGGEQRYPVKIYPVRYFTLNFNKTPEKRAELEQFFVDCLGQGGTFDFTWDVEKGGNGLTYTGCQFDSDVFKRSIIEMGYGENMQLTFYCVDRHSYTAPDCFDFYYKAKYDTETQFNTLIDKAITAHLAKRSLWTTPKKSWVLSFEKNAENRKLIEAFFISKRGKFKHFDWTWETDKGGDGQAYCVRFDTDELDLDVMELGYSTFEIPIKEVLPTVTSNELEKDEIIPRKLLEIELASGPIRILENDTLEKLIYNGQEFLGAPLELGEIKHDDNNEVVKISVTLSNVNQAISGIIGNHGDVITGATVNLYIVFLNTATNEIISGLDEILLYGKANNLELTLETAKMNIEIDLGGFEVNVPRMTYGVNCQWIKFKDCRCGYTGKETKCDRTLTRCKELGNVENFGGFPNMPSEQVIKA